MTTSGLSLGKIRFIGNAMTEEVAQDETAGFVTTSSDMPEVSPEPQEEAKQEEQAKSEATSTAGQDGDKSESKDDDSSQDDDSNKQDDSGEDAAAAQDKAKKPNRVQKRIDQVVREREEEKRKREALEREVESLRKGKSDKVEAEQGKEPVQSDFDKYDDYLDALDAYEKQSDEQEAVKEKPQAKDTDSTSSEALTDSQKTAMAVVKETVESADVPDNFQEVALNPDVPITGDMLEALAECDNTVNVMMHLGQNKDLAAEIAAGSPAQQMRAIAKLDLTVDSKPPKPTKTTAAPEPIAPVKGSDVQEKTLSEKSQAEYEAWANKQERRRSSW